MTLAWFAYVSILTAVLGITALALEHLSRRGGWATRWGWAGAIVTSVAIPAVLLFVPRAVRSYSVSELIPAVQGTMHPVAVSLESSAVAIEATPVAMLLESALLVGWATLSALLIALLGLGGFRLRRAAASWTHVRVAGKDVCISANLGPAVVGFLPSRIVLPRWMLEADASVQRMAVLHESEHISARDPQLILAALSCAVVMPWNLPLWWLLHRLRTAVEIDCDARVLRAGEDAVTYGGALLEVASSNARTPLLAPALIEPATQLEKRIALLGASARTLSKPLATATSVALLAIAGVAVAQIAVPQPLRFASAKSSNAADALGARLLDAVLERNSARAIELIEAGADPDYRRAGDGTPLIVAAREGNVPMVELLLARGANANLESRADGNPLIAAAASGHERIAMLLVAAGADVNGFVEDDETPLINAARGGHLGLVKYLVAQGADVSFFTIANRPLSPERRSALSEAQKYQHHGVADYLRANGARF